MLESLKLIIAQWLAPSVFRRAERYDRIIGKISYERHWIAVEFPQVLETMDRIRQQDYNYWRSLDEKPIGDIPNDISDFREYLRRTYKDRN